VSDVAGERRGGEANVLASYRGLEGVHQWQGLMNEIWADWDFQAERFFDAGDEVAVFVRTSGTARQSGAPVEISVAHVLTLRDGRVTRLKVFLDRHEALEALGLSE
jgi:ketosteroid isomerase-like protein